jgi:hypothetical protein
VQVDADELTLDICHLHDIEPLFHYSSTTFGFPRCFRVTTIVCDPTCRRDKTGLALPDWVYGKVRGGIRLVSWGEGLVRRER